MKKYKFFILGSFLVLVTLVSPALVSAVYNNDSGLIIGTRIDVSKDGTTWDNFTAEESPGGQTLSVKPGDTIIFRIKTWNEADIELGQNANPIYETTITNSQYLDSITVFANNDVDGAHNKYTTSGSTDVGGNKIIGIGLDGPLNPTGNSSVTELGTITAKIKSNTPDNTVIDGTFALTSPNIFTLGNPFISTVNAQQSNLSQSTVRILVSNPAPVQAQAVVAAPTTLPRTGADLGMEMFYGLIALVGIFDGYLFLRNKKTVKNRN